MKKRPAVKKCPAMKKCRTDHLKRLALASAAAILASIAGLGPHSASASDEPTRRQIHMIPQGGRGQLTRHAAKTLASDRQGTLIYTGRLDKPSLVVLPAKVYVEQRQKASASLDGPISKILVGGKLSPLQQHTLVVADPAQWANDLRDPQRHSSIHYKIVPPGKFLTLGRRMPHGFEGLLESSVKPIHVAIHNYPPPEGHFSETTRVAIRDIESNSPGIQNTAVEAPIYDEFSHHEKPTLPEMRPRLAGAWTEAGIGSDKTVVWTAGTHWPEAPAETLEESGRRPLTTKHLPGYEGDDVLITMKHEGPILRYDPHGIKGTLDVLDNLPGLAQISADPSRWLTANHKIREGQILLSANFKFSYKDFAALIERFDHLGSVSLPAILGESVSRASLEKGQPLELIALYFDHSDTN